MNIDNLGIGALILLGAVLGLILTLSLLTLPIKDDAVLAIELLDCQTILENSFDFKMNYAEHYYKKECL